jgi:hypothetical protein
MMPASRSRRKKTQKRQTAEKDRRPQQSKRRFRWPMTWVGNLISAVVVAAVTAAVTVTVTSLTQSAADEGEQAQPVHPGPPVLINSVQDLHEENDYAFPASVKFTGRQLSNLITQANNGNYASWVTRNGGVGVGISAIQLIVSGNAKGGARITNITLTKNCQQPLNGTLLASPSQGAQPSIQIEFNLDSSTSNAQTFSGEDYFSENTIELNPGEQQAIVITAVTHHFDCSYRPTLTVLANGRSVPEPIPVTGNGFRVTAFSSRYSSIYQQVIGDAGSTKFTPVNPETWAHPEADHHGLQRAPAAAPAAAPARAHCGNRPPGIYIDRHSRCRSRSQRCRNGHSGTLA